MDPTMASIITMDSRYPTPPSSLPCSPAKATDGDEVQESMRQRPVKRKWASFEDLHQFFTIQMAAVHRSQSIPQQYIDRSTPSYSPSTLPKPGILPIQQSQGFQQRYQSEKLSANTFPQALKHTAHRSEGPRQLCPLLLHKVLDIAATNPADTRLAIPKPLCTQKANQDLAAYIDQRPNLDLNRRIVDPPPPFQRVSADRYFKNTKFIPQYDAPEGLPSKKRKLYQESLNTPPASPLISTLGPQRPSTPRKYTPEERDDRIFRELETKYVTRVDRWFRTVLDNASRACPTSYGHFSRELLKMPTHVSRDWLEATKNNDVGREQCIIRLHELTYGLLARIRDECEDELEYDGPEGTKSTNSDGADPTLRYRAPLTGTGAWKEMPKFWQMLNGSQGMYFRRIYLLSRHLLDPGIFLFEHLLTATITIGAEVREYWIPVIQMHYGLNMEHVAYQHLFSV
jgi:hypothetical protein